MLKQKREFKCSLTISITPSEREEVEREAEKARKTLTDYFLDFHREAVKPPKTIEEVIQNLKEAINE